MARNDFSVLKTRVTDELHDSSLSTKVGDFINETIHDMHGRANMRFLRTNTTFTSVAAQQEYTISSAVASDVDYIIAVTNRTPPTDITEISKRELISFDPDFTDESGEPFLYYVQDDTLGLYPTPGDAETFYIDYIKFTTDLSADTDNPQIPLRWVQVIVDGAVARGLKYQRPGNPQAWTPQEQKYEKGVGQMIIFHQRKPNLRVRLQPVGFRPRGPVRPRIELFKT